MKKVSDEFKVGNHNIGYVENSFTSEFGSDELGEGKVLKSQKLGKKMTDSEIIKEFSIEECTMSDVLETIKNATEDMKDGYSNIFYIKGHSRVVNVFWFGGEWLVRAWSRGNGHWLAGDRVFSPAKDSNISNPYDSEPYSLSASKYEEMIEWLYLNTSSQLSNDLKEKFIKKLKEVLK